MANDYLKGKWGLWFRMIDARHKSKLSMDDIKENEDRFAIISHLDAEKKKEIVSKLNKLVNENIFYGKDGPITEQDFIEMQNEDFKADKENYIEKRKNYFTTLFGIIDLTGEGVTEEEFVNVFRAAGHENVQLDKQFFQRFNPVDGKIPLNVFVDAMVQFTTCEDSTKPDSVKEGIEAGV